MRHAGPSRSEARLLSFIAEELEKHLARDGGIQAACAALQRMGTSVVVNVTAAQGGSGPRVMAPQAGGGVPQWSEEDAEILRSMGIASDAKPTPDGSPSESGRSQPR